MSDDELWNVLCHTERRVQGVGIAGLCMIDNYELTDNVPDEVRYAILSNKKFIKAKKKLEESKKCYEL